MDEKIIEIANFDEYTKAEITKIALEREGVPCFLSGENLAATNWLYSQISGGIKLYIKESDRQKAESILNTIRQSEETNKDVNYDLRCPKCGDTNIECVQHSKLFSTISIILLAILSPVLLIWGAPLAAFRNANQCNACGHKWK
jgi:hypothetical protein